MEELNTKQLKQLVKESKKQKKKMKSGKRILFSVTWACIVLVLFTMAMIYLEKDTTSLTILAGAGVGILPFMYGIYEKNNTQINLTHMEKNYIPNYDEERGIY